MLRLCPRFDLMTSCPGGEDARFTWLPPNVGRSERHTKVDPLSHERRSAQYFQRISRRFGVVRLTDLRPASTAYCGRRTSSIDPEDLNHGTPEVMAGAVTRACLVTLTDTCEPVRRAGCHKAKLQNY